MRLGVILLLGLLLGCERVPEPGGRELTVMMGLAEVEWRVMREQVFAPFEHQHQVRLRGVQAEALDAAKKLVAMHRAQRMEVDLITQDVLQLAPLVNAGVMEDLSAYREAIPTTASHRGREFRWRHLFYALSSQCPDRLLPRGQVQGLQTRPA